MNLSLLKYPNKSHRKIILFPEESERLAEAMGIVFGDGGINNMWQLAISLNAKKDQEYMSYITILFQELFGVTPHVWQRRNENTLVMKFSAMNLVDFLIEKGVVRGNKIAQAIDIPVWIQNEEKYARRFVRGLVDTDGCLYTHKHFTREKLYVNIGFCFTSFSEKLTLSVARILRNHNIVPHVTKDNFRIYIYSEKAIKQYLEVFGSSNPRITHVYMRWRSRIAVHSTRLESARA